MKLSLLTFLFLLSQFAFAQELPRWIPLKESPSEADLVLIEAGPAPDSGLVYTSDGVRLYRSTDYGAQWQIIFDAWAWKPEPMELFGLSALATHPLKPGFLYVGSQNYGIWWTEDYGKTWKNDELMLIEGVVDPNIQVNRIGISPDGNVIFAGNARTENNFRTWTVMEELVDEDVAGFVFLSDGTAISVETAIFKPFIDIKRSTDMGKTWKEIAKPGYSCRLWDAPIIADQYDDIYIGISDNGIAAVLKSTDKGDSWTPLHITDAPSGTMVTSITYYEPEHIIYANVTGPWVNGAGAVYSSTDGGLHWTRIEGHPFNTNMSYLDVSFEKQLFSATGPFGAQQYDPFSGKWFERARGLKSILYLHDIQIDSTGKLYAISNVAGIHRTEDDGKTPWDRINTGITSNRLDIRDIKVNRSGAVVYACGEGKLYKSTNGGSNWLTVSSMGAGHCSGLQIDSANTIYISYLPAGASHESMRIIASADEGAHWDTVMRTPMQFHVSYGGTIYALTGSNSDIDFIRSDDRGQHWDTLTHRLHFDMRGRSDMIMHTDFSGRLYMASDDTRIWHSETKGYSWKYSGQVSSEYYNPNTYRLAFDRKNNVYLTMSRDSSILFSSNHGKAWKPMAREFPFIESLTFMIRIVFDKDDTPYGLDSRGTVYKYTVPPPPKDTTQLPVDTIPEDTIIVLPNPKPGDFGARVYPNPFEDILRVALDVPDNGAVSLGIYDTRGRHIASLDLTQQEGGYYTVPVNAFSLAPSTYLFVFRYKDKILTHKVIKLSTP